MDKGWQSRLLVTIVIGSIAGAVLSLLVTKAGRVANGPVQQLVDVATAELHDGWGNAAVQTLSMFYSADASKSDVQMLAFRPSLVPVVDWANGTIPEDIAGDL